MSYEHYARVYDQVGQSRFSERAVSFVGEVVRERGLRVRRVLDLACGTGTALVTYAQKGWDATGCDLSAEMLEQARLKALEAGVAVHLTHCPMQQLRVPGRYDLVTCFYDALNYIVRPEELDAVFAAVAGVLEPGGTFIFDVETEEGFILHWGEWWVQKLDDVVEIQRAFYEPDRRLGTIELTLFVREGNAYQRYEELHCQRAYPREEVTAALNRAGFERVDAYQGPSFTPAGLGAQRIFYVAAKEAA